MNNARPVRNGSDLGAMIRTARRRMDWSQTDLARHASMSQQIISGLENGVSSPRLDTILKVMAALGLDLAVMSRQKPSIDPTEY